jgi:hypothetical protein
MDIFTVGLMYWFLIVTAVFSINIGQIHNFLIALILLQCIGIIWEFDVFLETDMYNFLSEYLNMENLRNDAIKYITLHTKKWKRILLFPVKRLLQFFLKDNAESSDDLRFLSKGEKRKLFIYVLFLIVGILFTTFEYLFYTIPIDVTYVSYGINDVIKAIQQLDIILLTKSIAVITLITYDYFLLLYLRMKVKR